MNDDVASVIVEPVQGRAGGRLSDESWLEMLREVTSDNDIDLIFDEVFTGLGRIGSYTKALMSKLIWFVLVKLLEVVYHFQLCLPEKRSWIDGL